MYQINGMKMYWHYKSQELEIIKKCHSGILLRLHGQMQKHKKILKSKFLPLGMTDTNSDILKNY